ncbi:MAG TPA: hypothetical protein VE422_07615 [Terriglobia bacterium]|nr:hypothetical protein [Terriglobia bacterium]
MHNRRDFFNTIASAAAGTFVFGHGIVGAQAPPARRQVMIGGRRVRVLDIHAHCEMPLGAVVKGTPFENQAGGETELEERIPLMDKQGVDV